MLDLVLDVVLAWRNAVRCCVGIGKIDEPDFRRLMVVLRDACELARLGFGQRYKILRIDGLENQRVVAGLRADTMAQHAVRTMISIKLHVVERGRIRDPCHATSAFGNDVGDVVAGLDVAHARGVDFRTGFVAQPCHEAVVRRMAHIAELEIGFAFRQRVAVEQDFRRAAAAGLAANLRILRAFAKAREIGECAIGRGHRGVVLLDAALHFRKQRVLQFARVGERRVRIGVLGFEIGANVRRQRRRIADHGLPVGVAQPAVLIRQRDAMPGRGACAHFGAGFWRKCFCVVLAHETRFRLLRWKQIAGLELVDDLSPALSIERQGRCGEPRYLSPGLKSSAHPLMQ